MGTVQWRPYMHFTAQSTALQAFYLMISRLKKGELTEGEYPCVVVFMAFSIEAYWNDNKSRYHVITYILTFAIWCSGSWLVHQAYRNWSRRVDSLIRCMVSLGSP